MIIFVLLAAFIIRLINLNQSLWLDEAISILAAKNYSFIGIITEYAKGDFHPPGYFIILWIWGRLFGFSEVSMRFPSVIFGLLTIFLIYLIGKKLFSDKIALFAALLLSINPLHIYYTQEARMYSFATFAVCLNIYLLIKLLKDGKFNYFYFTFSTLLLLLSDYVAYLIFPAELIFILMCGYIKSLKHWFISLLVSLLVGLAWVPILLSQLKEGLRASANLPGWTEVVGSIGIKPLVLTFVKFIIGRIGNSNLIIYSLFFLPVGLLFAFLIFRSISFVNNNAKRLLIFWVLIPIILASLISILIPIYSYFRLLFVLPAFVLLVTMGLFSFKSKIRYALILVVVSVELICSAIYLINPVFQREDWRGLVGFLETSNNTIILFESNGSFAPFDYYAANQIQGIGALGVFPSKDPKDLINLETALGGTKNIYLVDYLVEIADPKRLVQKKLIQLNYKETDVKNFQGVGFVRNYVKS